MNPKIYAERIFYYEDAIKNPFEIVELLEQTNPELTDSDAITQWNEWVASGDGERYVFGSQKHTNKAKLSTSSEKVANIYQTLSDALLRCGKHYCDSLGLEYMEPSPISISKYQQGSSMGPHVDWHGETDIEPIMSAVLYLNDDLVGGELDFPELNVRIKPTAGSIIIFPSVAPYYHQSLEVKSGVKYMSPAFWIKRLV
jgi:predicted 2-oxoglutarate/Fe(II)-dependent dioxygenase YbiX